MTQYLKFEHSQNMEIWRFQLWMLSNCLAYLLAISLRSISITMRFYYVYEAFVWLWCITYQTHTQLAISWDYIFVQSVLVLPFYGQACMMVVVPYIISSKAEQCQLTFTFICTKAFLLLLFCKFSILQITAAKNNLLMHFLFFLPLASDDATLIPTYFLSYLFTYNFFFILSKWRLFQLITILLVTFRIFSHTWCTVCV